MTPYQPLYSASCWSGCRAWLPAGVRYRMALVPPDRARTIHSMVPFFGRRYRGTLARFID